jgi:TPR repeat protein
MIAGTCYFQGRGVPKDEAKAVFWYSAAAADGSAEAQLNLGMFALVRLLRVGQTSRGMCSDAGSLCCAGICYANGHGVAKDEAKVVHWFAAAAAQGHPQAQLNLGISPLL